jgi:nicotinamidase-related amidase
MNFGQREEKAMPQAFLVVDMLNDFVRPDGALFVPGAEEIIPNIQRELQKARQAGHTVIYVCDCHDADDLEFERYPVHAVEGEHGSEIITELAPQAGETVIKKKRLNAFYNTQLDQIIRQAAPDKVTVVGVVTHICVMEAVAGLCDRDIPARVPKDCVADFDKDLEESAFKRMTTVFGAEIA